MITGNEQKELLASLARLGGEAFKEEDVVFEGRKFVLPHGITLPDAIRFLMRKHDEEEETTTFSRTFKYRPWDGARATWNAFKKAFGSVAHKGAQGFFGREAPQLITLPVGPNETEQVPWGEFEVPMLPGVTIALGGTQDDEFGPLFQVSVSAPKKFRHHVEGLFTLIEEELRTNSMYRGKAIDGKDMAEFLDLSGTDPKKVVYSKDIEVQLEANVWSLLRHSQQMREVGMPLKRAVLLEGPYGTGKTLAAFLTAKEAQENGWTFLYARPGKDDLAMVMQTAKLYQPAVVFFEDMDVIASTEQNQDGVSKMLDLFDGITAKGTEIMVILTTNHPEKLHKGMMRPGRLDAVIHIGEPDADGIARMVQTIVPQKMLSSDVDYPVVAGAMNGFLPAYIKEACDRAVRYAIVRNGGDTELITLDTEDLVNAANGLRPQLELMNDAPEFSERDSLAVATEAAVTRAVKEILIDDVIAER